MLEIRPGTERAAKPTRQLLQFSRKEVMQARNFDLNDVVTNLFKMMQRVTGENFRRQLDLHPTELVIHADAATVEFALVGFAFAALPALR